MTENKNILKGNRHAELHVVTKFDFYGVVEVRGGKDKLGNVLPDKSLIHHVENATRIEAKREVEAFAKSVGGKLIHFGGFKN